MLLACTILMMTSASRAPHWSHVTLALVTARIGQRCHSTSRSMAIKCTERASYCKSSLLLQRKEDECDEVRQLVAFNFYSYLPCTVSHSALLTPVCWCCTCVVLSHPDRPLNHDMPLSWTDYGGNVRANASCNNGKVLYAAATNASTGQGSAWQKILACEENDAEALLTYAAIEYLHRAVGHNGTIGTMTVRQGTYRPFYIGLGHRT